MARIRTENGQGEIEYDSFGNITSCIKQTSLVIMAIIYFFNDVKILPQVIREM